MDLSKACMELLASLPSLDSLGLDSLQLDGSFQPLALITQLTCLSVSPCCLNPKRPGGPSQAQGVTCPSCGPIGHSSSI